MASDFEKIFTASQRVLFWRAELGGTSPKSPGWFLCIGLPPYPILDEMDRSHFVSSELQEHGRIARFGFIVRFAINLNRMHCSPRYLHKASQP
jgi:hypothetical protein